VLNKKGKYSLAKTWYDHFAKEYKTLYSESYPKTFDEVISGSSLPLKGAPAGVR
jgi:hypothetical protein